MRDEPNPFKEVAGSRQGRHIARRLDGNDFSPAIGHEGRWSRQTGYPIACRHDSRLIGPERGVMHGETRQIGSVTLAVISSEADEHEVATLPDVAIQESRPINLLDG